MQLHLQVSGLQPTYQHAIGACRRQVPICFPDRHFVELKDLEAGQGAPQPAQGKKQTVLDVGLDEEADNVADFMEV